MTRSEHRPMDEVFKALADPGRRELLDRLNARNGQNLSELCAGMDMARQSVSKHLEILEAADLVVAMRRGRERFHYLNAAPIQDIAGRWVSQYHQDRVQALADLKDALEGTTVQNQSFVYQTYIKTTPEQLWQGLTNAEFTRRYWSIDFETDWQPGSAMTWHHHGVTLTDPGQVVIAADPFRRLSYTWHSFTAELAAAVGLPEDTLAKVSAEPRSKVTFEIEDVGGAVKLTVLHDDFEPDSTTITLISNGWPWVLSDLKTLLETGDLIRSA